MRRWFGVVCSSGPSICSEGIGHMTPAIGLLIEINWNFSDARFFCTVCGEFLDLFSLIRLFPLRPHTSHTVRFKRS